MEMIVFCVYLIVFIFSILQIILFFKIWGMTNDVKKMTDDLGGIAKHIEQKCGIQKDNDPNIIRSDSKFKIGDLVVDKDECQWRVVETKGDIIICKNSTRGIAELESEDLKLF